MIKNIGTVRIFKGFKSFKGVAGIEYARRATIFIVNQFTSPALLPQTRGRSGRAIRC
jgi:hypothetical protein